jgi:type VI secretion system protein ImpC
MNQMPTSKWQSKVRLTTDLEAVEQPATEEPSNDRPFVIVVLGDFLGTADGVPRDHMGPLHNRQLLDIDRDNFDAILAGFGVRWDAMLEGLLRHPEARIPAQLPLRALEDFHPDRIVEQLMPLRSLIETRRGLEDPSRFEDVAAEVVKWAQPTSADAPPPPAMEPPELLDRILDQSNDRAGQTPQEPWSGDLQQLLKHIVRPYLVKIDTARQTALVDAVDQALAQQVRSILHHPRFRQLEAAWRSIHWLVNAAETGAHLKIRVLQGTKDELQQDLTARPALEGSEIARLLLEPTSKPGGQPPSLLIGNYAFAHTTEELALLQRLGGIAQRLRAPFVAAASPRLLGCASFTEISSARDLVRQFQEPSHREWQAFRRSSEARWLSLALPRFLLRLPYGAATEPVSTFAFEEHITGSDHEQLLWGNPAFAVGAVIVGVFALEGWSLDLTKRVYRLDGLPLYIYQEEGMAMTKPCAEVLLSERVLQALEEIALVPLVSYRDTDMVVLPCIQALGEPRSPLRWAQSR